MNNENYSNYIALIDNNCTEYATNVKLIQNTALYSIALPPKNENLCQLIAMAPEMNVICKQMTKQRILQGNYRLKSLMHKSEKYAPGVAKKGARGRHYRKYA